MNLYTEIDSLLEKIDKEWSYSLGYQILNKLKIHIDEDPLKVGLHTINAKIARSTNFKDTAVKLFKISLKFQSDFKRKSKLQKKLFETKKSKLLQSNKEVKSGSSASERSAIADTMLEIDIKSIARWEDKQEESKSFKECVGMEIDKLKDISMTLSRQFSIIEKEIELGLIDKEDFVKNKRRVPEEDIKAQFDINKLS